MLACLGTSSQVLFLIKALNSLVIALYHSGLDRASSGVFGMGEIVEVERLKCNIRQNGFPKSDPF
ncbi:hypothetical protein HanXRQr2_Chr12g0526731 [Helianthus annuus]|uniref:Uncharacterized protein n=1 Tax=Helianthus annuus TaxID=4232 RepID=A0A9K3EN66_HELAN|nr:hypothetical protein HanXRQr2_Chr12g0526731 [Helianthus annuus]